MVMWEEKKWIKKIEKIILIIILLTNLYYFIRIYIKINNEI